MHRMSLCSLQIARRQRPQKVVLFYQHFSGRKNIALASSSSDSLILELVEVDLQGSSRSNDANLDEGSE